MKCVVIVHSSDVAIMLRMQTLNCFLVNLLAELKDSKQRYAANYQSPYAMVPKKIGTKINEVISSLSLHGSIIGQFLSNVCQLKIVHSSILYRPTCIRFTFTKILSVGR